MGIQVVGLSPDARVSGVYLAVIVGGQGSSATAAPRRILIAGNKITANITAAAPSFTIVAGTQGNAAPILITSENDAIVYFGLGSELHLMARAVFKQYPSAELWAVAVAESGGARATAVLTFATNASAAFSIRLFLNGQIFDVAVANGDTPTAIATAVATAILARTDLPFTAQFSAGVLTITAKHPGPRGNDLAVGAQFIPASGGPIEILNSSTSSGSGTTGTFSGVGAAESTYYLTGGTTADDVTAALASINGQKAFHRQAWANLDATNAPLILAQLAAMATATSQLRQQSVFGSRGGLAGTITVSTSVFNNPRAQVIWHYNSWVSTPEIAATVAAARLFGDSQAGGTKTGELGRPNAKLSGLKLVGIREQRFPAEVPTYTELQSAESNGLTPLVPDGSRPGYVAIQRSITTRCLANAQPNYSVLNTANQTTPDEIAEDMQAFLADEIADVNLVTEADANAFPEIQNTTTVSRIRAAVKGRLKQREGDGWIRNVDLRDSEIKAEEDPQSPGRVNLEIPVEVAPALDIVGGNVRQRV